MKIKKLNLIRYGHFENHELEFADSGLTVIYGPNETGKSTSLSAISDLLYGFSRTCPYDFLFAKKDLRLGATLTNRAGDDLAFLRRKGNKDTLLSEDESPMADSTLTPFLGQSTREFFENSFGLSHERLREGGDAIGSADGDLGKILFEAGSGITSLADVQKMLDAEANSIFADRKSNNRVLYQSIDAYNDANTALKSATLKQHDWAAAQQDLTEARENLEVVRDEIRQITARQNELNRWQRILPILRELDTRRDELSELGDETALPANAHDQYTKAIEQRQHAQSLVAQTEQRLEVSGKDLSECDVDEPLISAADTIESLYERIAIIEQQLAELPVQKASLVDLQQQMSAQAERLDLPMKNNYPQLPRQPDSANLSDLVTDRQQIDSDTTKTRNNEAAISAEIEQLEQELAALGAVGDPHADTIILNELRTALAAVADTTKLKREVHKHERKLEDGLTKLSWWQGDVETLLKTKFPASSQIDEFKKSLERMGKKLDGATDKRETARDDLETAKHKLADYRKRETFHSDEDLTAARTQRQNAWLLVRGVIDGNPLPGAKELSDFEAGEELIPVYEHLTEKADSITDSRWESSQKVFQHEKLQQDVSDNEHACDLLTAKLDSITGEQESKLTEWNALWQRIDIQPESPETMRDGLVVIESMRESAAARDEIITELADHEQKLDVLTGQLRSMATRLEIKDPDKTDAAALASLIQAALDRQTATHNNSATLEIRIKEQTRAQAKHQQELSSLTDRLAEWKDQWNGCCKQVNLSPDLTPERVREILKAWDELAQKQTESDRIQSEITKSELRISQFIEAANPLAALDPHEMINQDAAQTVSGVRALHQRLVKMQEIAIRASELQKQKAELDTALANHQTEMLNAEDKIRSLMELARTSLEEDLHPAITKAGNRLQVKNDIAGAHNRLTEASEGQSEDALKTASENISSDSISAELSELAHSAEEKKSDLENATRLEEQAKAAVATLESKSGAGDHAQAMQNAVARMQVQTRDYLRFQAASFLLGRGIESIRDKHKNPILDKASDFFATLTTGSFSGLVIDYDNSDKPTIMGQRSSGERIDVHGMSDGTRDQLYLALRMAFVDNYCEKEEPLPFIGDDLFVHFDPDRTAAGLKLLSQMRNCQVILFTHHDHISSLAADIPGSHTREMASRHV